MSGARGTFHELWYLYWQPEHAVRLVEASRYGSTLAEAATALIGGLSLHNGPALSGTGLSDTGLGGTGPAPAAADEAEEIDPERAALVLPVLRLILGADDPPAGLPGPPPFPGGAR